MRRHVPGLSCFLLGIVLAATCRAAPGPFQPLAAEANHIPQTLLPLLHAEEVQQELALEGESLEGFLEALREVDAEWWPARNRPKAELREITAALETRMVEHLAETMGDKAVTRLRQLELQAQSVRALVRPEVVAYLRLSPDQILQLADVMTKAEATATEVAREGGNAQAVEAARAQERELAERTLTPLQAQRFARLLGEPFDTSRLERIYPLAPGLIDSGHWTTQTPLTAADLEGRVVLVHFYAFQCHNCVANFPHYKRWHKTFADKGVVVVGIQTPETQAERDVDKVKAAAKAEGFEFPVLIDLENRNWEAWGNTMWPTVYVVDKQGYIRGWWQGELNWEGATGDKTIESLVEKLLQE